MGTLLYNPLHCLLKTISLLRRSHLDNWRNPGLARAKLIQKLIMGLFIGFLYWQTALDKIGITNLNGAMFYIVAELTYSTLFGIVTFLPGDFPLLVREYHDGLYNSGSYFVARAASYVPLFALDGVILVATAYWMTGLVPTVFRFCIALGKPIDAFKMVLFFYNGYENAIHLNAYIESMPVNYY